jgi:phosphatidylglycerophosphatase A
MTASLTRAVATFGYIGHLPAAPGTWASAATLLLWFWISPAGGAFAIAIAAVLVIGTWACHRAEAIYGHDSHRVVIDEVAGSMIAVAGLSIAPGIGIAGFVLFRFFDIVKPPPIYQIQALPGGWGVMVDDVIAGIAANVVLRLGVLAWPGLAGIGT